MCIHQNSQNDKKKILKNALKIKSQRKISVTCIELCTRKTLVIDLQKKKKKNCPLH